MNTSTSKFSKTMISTTGILVVLIFWSVFSARFNSLILPSPGETWEALKEITLNGSLISSTLITLRRTFFGYGAAILLGFFLAIVFNTSRFWRLAFRPVITMIQTIPPVIWLVMAVIWFGMADDITPIFLIFIVTFPVIFLNLFSGLSSIDFNLVEMARVYRASRKQVILEIYLPSLIPHLVSGISIGLSFAWKATIFAEFIGSSSGIGYALSMAYSNFETEELFAWTIVIISLMLIFEYLILQPVQRHVTRWKQHE